MQIHNQLVQAAGANGPTLALTSTGLAQIQQMEQTEGQLFQQQYGTQLQALSLELPTVAAEWAAAATGPEEPVGPFQALPTATPEWNTFMTLHNQVMQSEVALLNQYITSDSSERDAAMTQWIQQNAALLQEFLTAAQNFSSSQN